MPPPSTVTDSSLANGNSAAPRFTPDVDGAYELALEASDGATSAVDTVIVTARAANVPPNANAGPDANAVAGQLVNLDGRGSTDPDNGPAPLGFRWSFAAVPSGSLLSDIDIAGASTALASFYARFRRHLPRCRRRRRHRARRGADQRGRSRRSAWRWRHAGWGGEQRPG